MRNEIMERDIQRLILDYLGYKKYFHWRNNTGAMKGEYRGKTWFVRFGEKGSPDIFVLIKGKLYGIEVKSYKGKQNQTQKDYEKRFKKAGGVYILARNLEDAMQKLEKR